MNGRKILALVLAVAMLAGTATVLISTLNNSENTQPTYNFSDGLNKNGYFKGVKATDYAQLPDYKSYTMPKSLTTVTDEAVEEQIELIKNNFKTSEQDFDAERVSAMGDVVNIDYVGSVDGVEFENGSTKGNGVKITIGQAGYLVATEECKGFEEQLVGHKVGDEFDITVQFPEGYNASKDAEGNEVVLSGKKAVFKIKFNSYYKDVIPEITDEFVAENFEGVYTDVEDMKAKIRESLIENQMYDYVWDKLVEETVIEEIPQEIIDFEKNYNRTMLEINSGYYNMTAEDFVKAMGFDSVDAYLEEYKEEIEETAKIYTMVQAVCEAEGIKAKNADVKEYFKTKQGVEDITQYELTYGTNYLRNYVLNDMMLSHLVENMEVVED